MFCAPPLTLHTDGIQHAAACIYKIFSSFSL